MSEDCLSNFPVCLFLKPAFYAPGKLLLRPKTLAPHDRIAKHEHLQRLAGGRLKVAGTIRARAARDSEQQPNAKCEGKRSEGASSVHIQNTPLIKLRAA